MKKYKTDTYSIDIKSIEIEKETEKTIFIRRENGSLAGERKKSFYYKYFDSFAEAREYLINQRIEFVKSYKDRIAKYESEIEKLKAMKEIKI
jgi:hypothetical protein